ncbi:MAG: hypothetical protein Q9M75_07425 [Ghiorsea sp.]|nr:hypothetical protein [Ghiorsea sp.]
MKKKIAVIVGMMALASAQVVQANEGHDMSGHEMKQHGQHEGSHHDMNSGHGDMQMDKSSAMFLEKKEVDGYTVSFHIMPAKDGMGHGGSHNLMVKVEQGGKALSDVVINSKVFHPNNSSESKMLMKMGDWYMAGYDLGHAGKHGVMILFKTADGKKHKTSIYYTEGK